MGVRYCLSRRMEGTFIIGVPGSEDSEKQQGFKPALPEGFIVNYFAHVPKNVGEVTPC